MDERLSPTDEQQPQSWAELLAAESEAVEAILKPKWDAIRQDEAELNRRKDALRALEKDMRAKLVAVASAKYTPKKQKRSTKEKAADTVSYHGEVVTQTARRKLKANYNITTDEPAEIIDGLEWIIADKWKYIAKSGVQQEILDLQKWIRDEGGTPDPGCDVEQYRAWKAWWENKELPHAPAPAGPSRLRTAAPTPAAPTPAAASPVAQPSQADLDAFDADWNKTRPPENQANAMDDDDVGFTTR